MATMLAVWCNLARAAPPVAVPTGPGTLDELALVFLDGTGSFDPDSDPISFSTLAGDPGWMQVLGPLVALTGDDTDTPSFTSPTVYDTTPLRFQLIVSATSTSAIPRA